jgi:RNA polymerase II subunit A-like phosphatase
MSSCQHHTVWGGLCVECGADVTKAAAAAAASATPSKATTMAMATTTTPSKAPAAVVPVVGGDGRERFAIMHGDERLVVTVEEAERLHAAQSARLLGARRLILVLDLDLTLIHATTARELQETTNRIGKTLDFAGQSDMYEFQLRSSRDANKFHIKLRPHLREFFAAVQPLFELHMYTMGSKAYAEEVSHIIDPGAKLFQGRILSRDACGAATSKDLKRLFPAGDQLAVVIDDRSDVWRTSDGVPTPNLLQIPPFRFFPVFHELNSLPQDKHEEYHDGNLLAAAADVRLLQMVAVLLDLHARFFAAYDATRKVRPIGDLLRSKRRTVLRGTRIMFSSVYGRDDRTMKALILQMAVQHGADCATELDEVVANDIDLPRDVTHVVARFDTTSKARAALNTPGVYLVSVDWFMESVARLQRLPESEYPVSNRPVINGKPRLPFQSEGDDDASGSSGGSSSSNSDDDDDDDDDDGGGGGIEADAKAQPAAVAQAMPEIRCGHADAPVNGYVDDDEDDDPYGAGVVARAEDTFGTHERLAKRARRGDDDDDRLDGGGGDDDDDAENDDVGDELDDLLDDM